MFEPEKLRWLQSNPVTAKRYDLDPKLLAAAEAWISNPETEDSSGLPTIRTSHDGQEILVLEEHRFKHPAKAAGVTRVLSVRHGQEGQTFGRLVENFSIKSNPLNDSGFWLNETMFYASLGNMFQSPALKIPKLYAKNVTASKSCIIIEFMDGCRSARNEAEFGRLSYSLGALAGISEHNLNVELRWLSKRSHQVSLKNLEQFDELTHQLASAFPAARDIREKFMDFIAGYEAIEVGQQEALRCICHGDAHGQNLLISEGGLGTVLLDWSHVHLGFVGSDLESLIPSLLARSALWEGDVIVANNAILDSYIEDLKGIVPVINPNSVKRSYLFHAILFMLAHPQTFQNMLQHAKINNNWLLQGRRLARLLNRFGNAARAMAASTRSQ